MQVVTISTGDLQRTIETALQQMIQPVIDRLERIELRQKGTHAVNITEFAHLSGFSEKIIRQLVSNDGYKGRRIEHYQLDDKGKVMIPIEQLSVLKRYHQGKLEFDK